MLYAFSLHLDLLLFSFLFFGQAEVPDYGDYLPLLGVCARCSPVHFLSVYFFSVYTRSTPVDLGRSILPIFEGGNAIFSLKVMHKPPSQKTEFLNSKSTAQTLPPAAQVVHIMGDAAGQAHATRKSFSVMRTRTPDVSPHLGHEKSRLLGESRRPEPSSGGDDCCVRPYYREYT